jgi:C4-dicarboxylate transporter DctQ subunit
VILPLLTTGVSLKNVGMRSNSMEKLSHMFEKALHFGIILGAIILVFDTLSVNAEIFSRYLFGQSLMWVVEISEISLLFITFLGAGWVLKKGGHVNVDIFLNKQPIQRQAIFMATTSIIGAISVLPLIWYGTKVTWIHYQKGLYEPTALNIPDVAVLFIIPLGSLLLFIQLLRRAYHSVHDWRRQKS